MTRQITLLISLVSAILVIALLARILPPGAAAILLDVKRASWPVTVQNILWLAFFVGLGGAIPALARRASGRESVCQELPAAR